MIDFRYHLVSLISVFLALAVGIVLGAGPLREGIGDTLTGQVEVLRADRDQLRADLEERTVDSNDRDAWISTMGAQVSAGTLTGRTVAIVVLPDATDDDVNAVADVLGSAGAQVTAQVRLTEAWTTSDASFRQTFAQQLAGYLNPAPAADAGPEGIMALAIAQMLQGWAGADGWGGGGPASVGGALAGAAELGGTRGRYGSAPSANGPVPPGVSLGAR